MTANEQGSARRRPNVLLILNDDMGYSDLGCYGGEIDTPHLDQLASQGLRMTQFYNTARCSPSRASLLTGLHPHQTGIGVLTSDHGPGGYPGNLNGQCVTAAEVLRAAGYATYLSGKWHLAHDFHHPSDAWPKQRGFDHFYGTIRGAGSYFAPETLTRDNTNIEDEARSDPQYYYTDAISTQAVEYIEQHAAQSPDRPFFLYVAYTAPHWPLHAREEDIAKYRGRFDKGWDALREERLGRMIRMGLIDESWRLTDRDPTQPPWEFADHKAWRERCMEVYAAQIDRMDQGIGRIIQSLHQTGMSEDTLVMFLADNGACAELVPRGNAHAVTSTGHPVLRGEDPSVMPGPEETYQAYGVAWANLSNTPFRLYKHWVHEGGIATPFIVVWPNGGIDPGKISHEPAQLTDILPTILAVTGAVYPEERSGTKVLPLEGESLVPILEGNPRDRGPLFWEHEGNAAIRSGRWKLTKDYPGPWELYDMAADRTETHDLSGEHPDVVQALSDQYEHWAARCGVIPREQILRLEGKTAN